jgi:hypothetical protein
MLLATVLAGCTDVPTTSPVARSTSSPSQRAGQAGEIRLVDVAPAWANNSVNTVVFRKNSLVSDKGTQYVAFYDQDGYVVLGKRRLGDTAWTLQRTRFQGHVADAHNTISIMVDGAGYLHVAWDHHNNELRYARSVSPGSLELGDKQRMTGQDERSLTYPEFHRLPDGNLLFLYRNGASGQGNLVANRYDVAHRSWQRLSSNLISGEGQRSAYWQAFVDHLGTIHVSWVWRESPDVASNHDLAYARSRDGGQTWEKSTGERYTLPITAASAEYAARIPENSELINQTSMSTDRAGRPYIATYWRDQGSQVPQYRVVHLAPAGWKTLTLDFRKTPFSLGGAGTKAIPIARPQVLVDIGSEQPKGLLIFRDEARGNRVSAVDIAKFDTGHWTIRDLTEKSVGAWEPSYDTELWRSQGVLNLFVEDVSQVDGEGQAVRPPSMVRVLEWKPGF